VKIRLDLSRHCIETEIRRLYNTSVSRYFRDPDSREALEIKIDVLQKALERLDFPFLRSHYASLAGGVERDIFLVFNADEGLQIITPEEEIRF